LEKSSGRLLGDFFSRWVYDSGHPVYVLTSRVSKLAGRGREVTILLKQTQPGAAFLDPVPIEITNGQEKRLTTIQPLGKEASAKIRVKSGPMAIRVDPDQTLLKEVVSGP